MQQEIIMKNMEKVKIHQFDPVIYPYKIWVVVNNIPDIISEQFYQFDSKEIESWANCANLDAFAMPVRNKEHKYYGCILFFSSKESMTYNIVAHESCHAAKNLFEYIDADMKHHEPFEYVVGWIAECCESVKNNIT